MASGKNRLWNHNRIFPCRTFYSKSLIGHRHISMCLWLFQVWIHSLIYSNRMKHRPISKTQSPFLMIADYLLQKFHSFHWIFTPHYLWDVWMVYLMIQVKCHIHTKRFLCSLPWTKNTCIRGSPRPRVWCQIFSS